MTDGTQMPDEEEPEQPVYRNGRRRAYGIGSPYEIVETEPPQRDDSSSATATDV